MKSYIVILLLMNLYNLTHCNSGGQFEVSVMAVLRCNEDEHSTEDILFDSTRISKSGRNDFSYSSNVTLKIPFDNTLDCSVDVAVFGNGGWKPHFIQYDMKGVCDAAERFIPEWFKQILQNANVSSCPLPIGTYYIDKIPVQNVAIGNLPTFPYGKYRTTGKILSGSTLVGCLIFEVKVYPKKKKNQG